MRLHKSTASLLALFTLGSCSDNVPVSPLWSVANGATAAVSLPDVRISEFHYDNSGTDVGEAVEISGPAGTDLSAWSLVLYNGNSASRAPYTTTSLSGQVIPATCGTRGVIVGSYPTNGIQNGASTATGTDPDGFALVNGATVVEFLSYEGSFTAASGAAAGLVSTDIGIRELGTEPAGQSLQRDGSGTWSGPLTNTFGACNDNDVSRGSA